MGGCPSAAWVDPWAALFSAMGDKENIDIEIIERDGVLVVVVEGDVDLSAAAQFEESLARAQKSDASAIIIDLDRVSFMDSAGVHVLLQASLSERNRNRLALTPGSPQVRRLLEVTGVRRYLSFVPSPELGADRSRRNGRYI
jgi:anti-sigma B factor antagonist